MVYEICFGSGNGLLPMEQAITWTADDQNM